MAYIYIIKNGINNKVYIGKTERSIEQRFLEHKREAKSRRTIHRPLYHAINKYGEEHFFISLLEKCSSDQASEKEIYWINYYNSYHDGYNATLGGDGKTYLNYKKILKLFDTTQLSQKEIAKECNCHYDSVKNIVEQYRDNVDWVDRYKKSHKIESQNLVALPKAVKCIEENKIFTSTLDAAHWLVQQGKAKSTQGRTHISAACKGKREKSYGYHWTYV